MINIVLFDNESIIRIADRAIKYFSSRCSLRTTEDTIWIDGLYLRFYPQLITLNAYNPTILKEDIFEFLSYILSGEEVFVTDGNQNRIYISVVDSSTDFDAILFREVV